jgi:hypothetical protein
VIRPLASLLYSTEYRVLMSDIADVAGNQLAATTTLRFATPRLVTPNTPLIPVSAPMTVVAISPGAPCALEGASGSSPGRCVGGAPSDAPYRPFTLEAEREIDVELSRPLERASAELGTACGTGSVRVEELSAGGGCVRAVPGTLLVRDRGFTFVPDRPWIAGTRYRLNLVSGPDASCGAGELCARTAGAPEAASFDPLAGTRDADAGGPNLTADFTGVAPTGATAVFAQASPWTDINGSGFVDTGEVKRDENRAALRITGTTGNVQSASFPAEDCLPGTPEREACMYLLGAMPVAMGELTTACPIPGGAAPSCVPVTIAPQAMYATSIQMEANLGFVVSTNTGTAILRIREPASGPVTGYIYDDGGTPKLAVALDLYMDAPSMDLPATFHDLHSKALSVTLDGPVKFLPDGRIAIESSNTADLPVEVNITAAGLMGSVRMIVPMREMKLRLVSRPLRGVER